jgi:hypothetical protein
MNASTIKMAAVCAWAAAAISSATTAHAWALTASYSSYQFASCSQNYSYSSYPCGTVSVVYQQNIKFLNVACGSGGCAGEGAVYVDFIYPAGRKTAAHYGSICNYPYSLQGYTLGSCSC